MQIRAFLADDHAVLRDGLRLLLEAGGDIAVVGSEGNGRDTLLKVQQLKPDVVVMDISMPQLNGIEATQQICSSCPNTKVIILSVYSTSEHVFRALRAGAKGYLLKDSAGDEVVEAVRAIHSGRHYFSRPISEIMVQDYIKHRLDTQAKSPLESLSSREREVLQLLVEGRSNPEIANCLCLSVKSVETYRSRLMQKLGISDLPGLVKFAIQQGLTPVESINNKAT
jgi:DNA-binding NarL/FixJ family response regulator